MIPLNRQLDHEPAQHLCFVLYERAVGSRRNDLSPSLNEMANGIIRVFAEEHSMNGRDILVFIPTYNDVTILADIASQIRGLSPEIRILIVDDGSTPAVSLQDPSLDVLHARLPANFGLGVCTHVALEHALSQGCRAVVRIDADGQHPVSKIPELLQRLDADSADIVVGTRVNRNIKRGLAAWARKTIRWYLTTVAALMSGSRAPKDVNSGFFVLNSTAIQTLNKFQLDRYPEPQIFILSCREGLRIEEIHIEQMDRRDGTSTLNIVHALRLLYRFNIFIIGELLRDRSRMS
jgi:polyprenyl-phospho-N-acetylgalactosaminyl synthase